MRIGFNILRALKTETHGIRSVLNDTETGKKAGSRIHVVNSQQITKLQLMSSKYLAANGNSTGNYYLTGI